MQGNYAMPQKRIITPKHYQGIGEIVATWARLESHMLQTFRALLDLSATQTLAIFWEMQFRNRLARLRTLAALKFRAKDDPRREEFASLMKEIESAYFIRNLAAHCIWHKGKSPKAITPLFVNAKNGKIRTTHPQFQELKDRDFSPKRFREEAVKIADLAERFKEFSSLHFGAKFLHSAVEDGFD